MNHRLIDSWRRGAARRLRSEMTDAERRLWYHIRAHRFFGASFRRQWPVGPFIVDFVCLAARLVIEVDGDSHADDASMLTDQARTKWLEDNHFRVVRFWNSDVSHNLQGVLDELRAVLEQKGHDTGDRQGS